MTEDFRLRAPEPAAPRPFHFPHVVRATLDNGLRVLVARSESSPLVSTRVVIHSGSDADPEGLEGVASLTASLLDEGAGERDAMGIAESVGNLGAFLGTGADWDASYAWLDLLGKNLREGMEIVRDITVRPRFEETDFARVRDDRLTSILQQRDQPSAIAAYRFSQFVYLKGRYAGPMIGTEQSVSGIRRDHVAGFYRTHGIPNNASLIAAGDLDPDGFIVLAGELFGGWPRGAEVPRVPVHAHPLQASQIYLIDRPESVQSEIRVGHVGVPRNSEDYFPIVVMNSILGEIFNSRIMLNLRERHGFTYGARSAFVFRRHAGPFVVSTAVRNDVTMESIREILAELTRIRSGDVTDEEMHASKSYLMGVFPAMVQTANDLTNRIQEMELYGLPTDYFDHYRDRVAAVDRDEITRVANKYISPDRSAIIVVGKASEITEPLSRLGHPVGLYDLDGLPVEMEDTPV